MRRRKLVLLALATLMVGAVTWSFFAPFSRGNINVALPDTGKPEIDPLPITQLVLFNSGVGYVQREGTVEGNADIDLLFNTTDINDLLKSMVLEDLGGGKVTVVSYDSSDPVDRILHSFALDLTSNPTFGQILNQARGEKMEATIKASNNSPQTQVKGTVVGMEARKTATDTQPSSAEVDFLNLLGEAGLKSIPLNNIEQVRFLNPVMDKEFQEALHVLAGSHDVQKKRVTISFKGAGKRMVRLGYVVEKPIWKMTYRLRMEKENKLFLQGWAIVENTSDNDWKDVTMTLVSGKPISYKMDLYEPLYIPRPTVEPDLFASLRPPIYDATLPGGDKGGALFGMQGNVQNIGGIQNIGGFNIGGFNIGGIGGYQVNGYQINGIQGIQGFQGPMAGNFQGYNIGGGINAGGFNVGGFNIGGQSGNSPFLNNYQAQSQMLAMQQQELKKKLTYDELLKRKLELQEAKQKAKDAGEKITGLNFKETIDSLATTEDIGDYFQYRLDQKVSLSRKRSSMLPVFNSNVSGEKVSIYNRTVHKRFPLLGLRFKNTTDHPLTQGPVTVYDQNNYAGDTRILDVPPDEERLLSYAMDLGTKVYVNYKSEPDAKAKFRLGTDQSTVTYTMKRTTKYLVKNDSKHDRLVILEHPIEADWKLVDPAKPAAKTPNHYRFEIRVKGGKSETFEIVEEQERINPVSLIPVAKGERLLSCAVDFGTKVYMDVRSEPASKMTFKIGTDQLTATYNMRRTTKYLVENDSKQDRQVIIEHPIEPDWKVVDPAKVPNKSLSYYRFEISVAKGKSQTVEFVEEQKRADPVSLMSLGKEPPLYSVYSGIAVKPITKMSQPKLTDVKIVKGQLQLRHKTTETIVYYVQNNSDQDRSFTIDHLIPPQWTLIDPKQKKHPGPGIYRVALEVKAGKTESQEITQETIAVQEDAAVWFESPTLLQTYINSPVVSDNVKKALQKTLALHSERSDLLNKLAKLQKNLTALNEEQSRVRENLKIIPQNSDPYKQFLDKFVKLETQIGQIQEQVSSVEASLDKKTKEYNDYSKSVTAD